MTHQEIFTKKTELHSYSSGLCSNNSSSTDSSSTVRNNNSQYSVQLLPGCPFENLSVSAVADSCLSWPFAYPSLKYSPALLHFVVYFLPLYQLLSQLPPSLFSPAIVNNKAHAAAAASAASGNHCEVSLPMNEQEEEGGEGGAKDMHRGWGGVE